MGKASTSASPTPPPAVDREELESAVRDLLSALGEDVSREGIADTPKRVAKAMEFAVRGYGMSAVAHVESALFHEQGLLDDETNLANARREALAVSVVDADHAMHDDVSHGTDAAETLEKNAVDPNLARPGVVLIRDVPFFSTDERTLLPFYGVCHVGYVPSGGVIVGLSKVARVAEVFARRVQTPARLASDVAHALQQGSSPKGVRVIVAGSQMAPTGPRSVFTDAAIGCLAIPNETASETSETKSVEDDAAEYRVEFEAMLHAGVGAGQAPPVGLTGLAYESGKSGKSNYFGNDSRVAADRRAPKRPRMDLGAGAVGVTRPSVSGSDDGDVVLCSACGAAEATGLGDDSGSERLAELVGRRRSSAGGATGSGRSGSADGSEDGDLSVRTLGRSKPFSRGVRELREKESRPATPSANEAEKTKPAGSPTVSAEVVQGTGGQRSEVPGTVCVNGDALSKTTIGDTAVPKPAPDAAHAASTRMAKALGLHKLMTPEQFAQAARAYADVMAASREGHVMELPVVTEGGTEGETDEKNMTDMDSHSPVFHRDLELATLCEHHLLPFHGAVHVEYVGSASSSERLVTLTRDDVQKIVTRHGRRFQVQERLTRDIARDVQTITKAKGVMVTVRASHLCMIARGVEKPGSTTVTSAALGAYAEQSGRRTRFWQTLAQGSQDL